MYASTDYLGPKGIIQVFSLRIQDVSIQISVTNCVTLNCVPLRWRHNGRDGVSNHQPHDCLLNRLFRRRSKKTSKLRVTDLCAGNSPGTGEFPAQMASNAENFSIWWRHHGILCLLMEPTSAGSSPDATMTKFRCCICSALATEWFENPYLTKRDYDGHFMPQDKMVDIFQTSIIVTS